MSTMPRLLQDADDCLFDAIADGLRNRGYIVLPQALPTALVDKLFLHFRDLEAEQFSYAGVGKQDDYQVNRFIRTDAIAWLDNSTVVGQQYLDWMERLRLELNRRLYLGLFDFESHYAWYAEGAFYKKHHDAFRGQTTRIVSTVLYLNPTWTPEDGGELLLYSPENEDTVIERIAPQYGKLVLFLSEEFPHEVLPVNSARYSIAGWFRVNNSLNSVIDPPQ